MPEWFLYFVAMPMAALIVSSSVYALYWSSKNGQLRNFEEGSKVIFDESEPIGQATDQVFAKAKNIHLFKSVR